MSVLSGRTSWHLAAEPGLEPGTLTYQLSAISFQLSASGTRQLIAEAVSKPGLVVVRNRRVRVSKRWVVGIGDRRAGVSCCQQPR